MNVRYQRLLFMCSFLLPLIFFRIQVVLKQGRVSFLRSLTGYTVHHSHYGVILVTVAIILLIFYGINRYVILLAGLGTGTMLDSFISSLMPSISRAQEIVNYQGNLLPTIVLFMGIVFIVYIIRK
jgi:hypothetical protein